jgi:glutamate N-acetyltransferase/amino-acid N-acetyltransferase
MMKKKDIKIHGVNGISLSSVYSGMYAKQRLDLSILEISCGSNIAGVFTKNKAKSPSVIISSHNINKCCPKYLIVNSGNANAGTGDEGLKDINKYCKKLSLAAACKTEEILVFSTGVIGERIKTDNIIKSIPKLLKNLHTDSWIDFSNSILTTDTCNKIISKKIKVSGKIITITGVAKGSGMIMPNMATMLSFVATDIKIGKVELKKMLKKLTESSYNMITVDGDTSTNDSSILIATGKSLLSYENLTLKDKKIFYKCIDGIYKELAKKIIYDGEGATKFVTINVKKVNAKKQGKEIAMSIANSLLVKTALFAQDPNWGRILSAIGNANTNIKNLSNITISLGKILIFKDNKLYKKYNEKLANKYLKNKNIEINVIINTGKEETTVWTTDLSYEYIKINAEYRT